MTQTLSSIEAIPLEAVNRTGRILYQCQLCSVSEHHEKLIEIRLRKGSATNVVTLCYAHAGELADRITISVTHHPD